MTTNNNSRTDDTVDTKINRIARVLGIDAADIRVSNPNYRRLLQEGLIATMHISRWRARVKLTPRDLGLEYEPDDWERVQRSVRLGDLLVAPKSFTYRDANGDETTINPASIETRARNLPRKHGFKTPFGYMVPCTAFGDFYNELNELAVEYDRFAEYLYENWIDRIRPEIVDRLASSARVAYKNYIGKKPGDELTAAELDGEDDFVDRLVASQIENIPSREYIRRTYKIWADLDYVPLPDELGVTVSDNQVERLDAWDALERNKQNEQMREIARQTLERKTDAFAETFLNEIAVNIFETARDAYRDFRDSIQRNGYVHPRSVVGLKALKKSLENFAKYAEGFGNIDETIAEILNPADKVLNATVIERDLLLGEIENEATNAIADMRSKLTLLTSESAERKTRATAAPEWAVVADNTRRRRAGETATVEMDVVETKRKVRA